MKEKIMIVLYEDDGQIDVDEDELEDKALIFEKVNIMTLRKKFLNVFLKKLTCHIATTHTAMSSLSMSQSKHKKRTNLVLFLCYLIFSFYAFTCLIYPCSSQFFAIFPSGRKFNLSPVLYACSCVPIPSIL